MTPILAALWKVLVDVFVELLNREDVVADEVEPELDSLDPGVSNDDLLDRYDGLLDAD